MKTGESSEQSISVHVAGGDYLTGLALAQLFNESGFITVTGFSTRGRDAVKQMESERPDVVLMDALITDREAAATTTEICHLRSTKVVILSAHSTGDTEAMMHSLFQAGTSGYLRRDLTLEDIAAALRIVHRGGLVNAVFSSCTHTPHAAPQIDLEVHNRLRALSSRDLRIVAALSDGHTNMQIARKMNLSEATVKARLARVMQQLGMENRVQIAVAAVRAGVQV
ncbi:response regulator transcription factor [Arthrobacter sp. H5]|uniref:LuxR C-terminal-related transcriptional regulator n=1 Tax=Arthrobacter sp. H5 TaxID=1267973 RepID=UPI0004870916|nr:response regulator transcription factor [Arthrobacter sp. H5]